jgi:uncharacterized membrane protein
MGFCLAEMGLNLAIPNDPSTFARGWFGLAAFAMSFLFVSVLWWFHHKLFATYFALSPLTVVMNFVMLGSLALAIYFLQVSVHFMIRGVDPSLPLVCWMIALAVVYAIISALYWIGIAYRKVSLSAQELRFGVNRVFRTAVVTILMATFSVAFLKLHHVLAATYAIVAASAILGVVRRALVPRIAAKLLTDREIGTSGVRD